MDQNDARITIIGAGVVGLAIAYQLSKKYDNIFVIEKNRIFGEETSSRSSEVIHSGLYYPVDSLKKRLCIEGRKLIYAFCEENGVVYNKSGKLIIAVTKDELLQLERLKNQAIANGVDGMKELSVEEISVMEPNIKAIGALWLQETGVLDTYGYMKELEKQGTKNGVQFVYGTEVQKLKKIDTGYSISLKEYDGSSYSFTSDLVINAAGLQSDIVSQMLGIDDPHYELQYCKGEYFAVGNGKNLLVKRLIYPVPNPNLTGLGIHVTIDVDKGLKLGPNAVYLNGRDIDYGVDSSQRDAFFESAKRFLPFLEKEDLYPAYSGVRPKIQKQGESFKDFVILEEIQRGFPGYFNLIGIESPGLTASLAIGNYINELINKN